MKLNKVSIESIHVAPPMNEDQPLEHVVWLRFEMDARNGNEKLAVSVPYEGQAAFDDIARAGLEKAYEMISVAAGVPIEEWQRLSEKAMQFRPWGTPD